ncbi:hypothetical protein F8279_04940 [Micromonospora sp. AMSO1212t]|uniref:hypothetical protein n=1 Tax=Micromonospora sp. AMSO1212t TaxID=2650565 RepID=UPI00124B3BDC|nr:hypothetical protein [Micromonospora sp. AMSO1212t]KAB1909045.1 hypothetical protein F8279_04940 [Micromonospora sp. AMSO1212t]
MLNNSASIEDPSTGDYIATISGGPRVGILVDGQPDPAPFESTLPDASRQLHRSELLGLRAGQQVSTSPPGLPLWPG